MAIPNKQKCHLFIYPSIYLFITKLRMEGRTGPIWGMALVQGEGNKERVEILYTHV
jgi:hypothetical protein